MSFSNDSNNQASQGSSFFEDQNNDSGFQFVIPGPNSSRDLSLLPLYVVSMSVKYQASNKEISGLFGLQGSTVVKYENKVNKSPLKILEAKRAKLSCRGLVILLRKNQTTLEFAFPNEDTKEKWVSHLRKVCIMTDFDEKYTKLKMIKNESSVKKYLIKEKNSEKIYSAKIYWKNLFESDNQSTPLRNSLVNEINLFEELRHQNIVQLHEIHETTNFLHLIIDPIQGVSLEDLLSRQRFKDEFTDDQLMHIFHEILDCAAFIASKGVTHRDLSPKNIILEKGGRIKLIDIGLSTPINLPKYIFSKCGTPGYVAPEVFEYIEGVPSTRYNDRCDVFSAGCIFFYMLFGYSLFGEKTHRDTIDFNNYRERLQTELATISTEIKNKESQHNKQALKLLQLLLEPNHKKRISAKDALKHDYFAPLKTKKIAFGSSKDALIDEDKPDIPTTTYVSVQTVSETDPLTKSQLDSSEPTSSNFNSRISRTSVFKNEHTSLRSSIFRNMKPHVNREELYRRNSALSSPVVEVKPNTGESSRRHSEGLRGGRQFNFSEVTLEIKSEESEVYDGMADDETGQIKVFIERIKATEVKKPGLRLFV